jgi:16S rRNA (guanine966-N2)-methyltransferase
VRPTADRVRESLFARLGDVSEARVLDLFAGTGAMGIEAISRGAESLVSVDRSARVIRGLEAVLAGFGIGELVQVIHAEAKSAVNRMAQESRVFDLIFLDPPYDEFEQLDPLVASLVDCALIAPNGVVVVESAKRHAVPPVPGLVVEDARTF